MKKYLALLLCFVIILSGCNGNNEAAATIPAVIPESVPDPLPETSPAEDAVDSISSDLLAVSVPAVTDQFILDDGTLLFSYTSQHMQLSHPDENIADKVIVDFLNRVDDSRLDAENVLMAAQNDYSSDETWFPYFCQAIYSPTRIDYGVLSLFGTQSSYSGSHHSNLSCVAANYDLTTGDALTLGSIMHMDASTEDFIEILIDKLEALTEVHNLFSGFEDGVRSRLGGDENLYEDFFFTTTGLSFFFAPYEIAPYASGVITVEIPYEELTGLIYDGYFPAERSNTTGTMHSASFMDTDMEQFSNVAEVTLASGEEIMVVYPDGEVQDVRITVAADDVSVPEYTVFVSYQMSEKNAVVISLPQESIESITVQYTADGNTESISLAG